MKTSARLISFLLALLLIQMACNFPSKVPPTQEPGALATMAAQTVEAQLTQIALQNSPTPLPTVFFPTQTPTAPILPSPTPIPPSPTAICDAAQFVTDVTIPDGTLLAPGTAFTKTWRLKNVGTCSWTPSYAVVFVSGNAMSGPATQALTANVNPGQSVDISVNLVAPSTPGNYRGYWKLRNAAGVLFASFYVDINVGYSSAGFDFHTQAPSAEWIGGDSSGGVTLTFGGPDTNSNGFAMFKNGERVEDGSKPAKVLETHPKWVVDGVISGKYPAYTVQAGEHFLAQIGFLAKADGTCGVGNAIFQLNYEEGGTIHPLSSWTDTCDGNLQSVDVNLNTLAGHTVRFILAVLANGSADQDWAVWISPRIQVP